MQSKSNQGEPVPGRDDSTASLPYADHSTPHAEDLRGSGGVTRRDIPTITVKVIGVYMMLQGFPALVSLGQFGLGGMARIPTAIWLYTGGMLAFYVGVGWLLLRYGERLGVMLLPKSDGSPPVPFGPWSPVELQATALAVVGLTVIVVWAVPGLVSDGWRQLQGRDLAAPGALRDMTPYLVHHACEFVLGIWLFYGSRRISLYWRRLRHKTRRSEDGPL